MFHLKFAGVHAVSLLFPPCLVPANLVRFSGVLALTGPCLVDMLPRDGVSSESKIFLAKGCHLALEIH